MLLLLALCFTPQATAPSPFEILRTWTGKEYDHLGIGLSALGDVDGDGTPDFVLGAMQGAYAFSFGPGHAQVISGKDGRVLYTVRGLAKAPGYSGDAFGDTVAALGDLDKDGVSDFAVGAWRHQEFNGCVRVYSGKTGAVLATLEGSSNFGSLIVSLGDLDGDHVPDFAASGDHSTVLSGASFLVLGECSGHLWARAGDLLLRDMPSELDWVTFPKFQRRAGVASGRGSPRFLCGDVDLDGWPDLLRIQPSDDALLQPPGRSSELPVQFLSGKDGAVLRSIWLPFPSRLAASRGGPLGDASGDGVPDVFAQAERHEGGACVWVLDGKTGAILASTQSPSGTFGRKFVPLGDIDHDGRPEFLLSDFESKEGSRCGGAVHLVRIRVGAK